MCVFKKLLCVLISMLFGLDFLPIDALIPSIKETDKIIYIFVHGLGGNSKQVGYYRDFGIIPMSCEYISEDGPEVGIGNSAVVLAQDNDISCLKKAIKTAYKKYGDSCKIILVGVSKGAGTIFNAVGKLAQKNSKYLKNIIGIIGDSSPADFNDVVYEKFIPNSIKWICPEFISKKLVKTVLHRIVFKSYDPYGLQPITSIKEQWGCLDKNMIIVLVHSKEDDLINISHANKIYDELKKQGFNNLYFIQAEKGAHANVFWGDSYESVLQSLWCIYKKHNLIAPLYKQCAEISMFKSVIAMSDDKLDESLKTLKI